MDYVLYDGEKCTFFPNGWLVTIFSAAAGRSSGSARAFPTLPKPSRLPERFGKGVACYDDLGGFPLLVPHQPLSDNFRAYTFWLGVDGEIEE